MGPRSALSLASSRPSHHRLNSTLVYARAHDQTVAEDYFAAMGSVEKRLELVGQPLEPSKVLQQNEREQLLTLTEQLAQPEVGPELRLDLVTQIRVVLTGSRLACQALPATGFEKVLFTHAPPLYSWRRLFFSYTILLLR